MRNLLLVLLVLLIAFSSAFGAEESLTGCLTGPNEGGTYTLTFGKNGDKTAEVGIGPGSRLQPKDLQVYVNHEVMLTGRWFNVSTFEVHGGRSKTKSSSRLFAATKVAEVSESCAGKTGAPVTPKPDKRN